MKNEEIKKARKEYARQQKEKSELIALKIELNQLKMDPKVQRYLDICYVEDSYVPYDGEIISYSFLEVDKSDDDFNIYIYRGAYKIDDDLDCVEVFDIKEADYLMYMNIANIHDTIQIKPNMQEQFENENFIIKLEGTDFTVRKFYELQQVYYEYLLTCDLSQKEKVLEKIKEHL